MHSISFMESFPTPYPVVFFDGEQEQDKGFIDIHSVLTFKRFQSLLSHKMGLPPSQLSTVFVSRRMLKDSGKWQRLPITGNTNFNLFLNEHNTNRDRECYFLVSLKKPRKERKGSKKFAEEREARDAWMFNSTKGMRGRNQINETLVDGTGLATGDIDFSCHMNKLAFADDAAAHYRGPDSKAEKIILKRTTPPTLLRNGFHFADLHASGNDMADQFVQFRFQGGARLAALHQEIHRDYNWDPFPRLDQPGIPPYPSMAPTQLELEYHHNSMKGFNGFLPEGPGIYKNGPFVESPYQHPYKNRDFDWSYNLPKSGCYTDQFSKTDVFLQPPFDWAYKKGAAYPDQFSGTWQDAINNLGMYPDSQDHECNNMSKSNANQSLQCHLCFECKSRNVTPIPFHWCVEDAVTNGFQGPSPAGPIGKRQGHDVKATA